MPDDDNGSDDSTELETYLIDAIVDKFLLIVLLRRNLRKIKVESLG